MKKKRILCIDDDVSLTRVLRINLEDTGHYEVCVENDSSNALSTARDFRPDLILLDVVMPGLDGGDINAQLKNDRSLRSVPVIMVTALVSNGETGDGAVKRSGAHIMVAKPIRFDTLLTLIEGALPARH